MRNKIITSFFCLLLAVSTLAGLLLPDRYYSEREKRTLTQKPKFTVANFISGEFSGELEKYPKNFFLAQESDLYLAVCMQDALNHLPVSRTADLYDYFADEEKGWSFLKKACLYTPAHNFYDYPIDVLHASLEPDQRSELDYHYGRFCCAMKRQKRKRRYRACASESTTGT